MSRKKTKPAAGNVLATAAVGLLAFVMAFAARSQAHRFRGQPAKQDPPPHRRDPSPALQQPPPSSPPATQVSPLPPRKADRPLAGSASEQSRAAQTQTRTPEEAERWQRAGRLVRDGRRSEAEELLERAVRLEPTSGEAYLQLGKYWAMPTGPSESGWNRPHGRELDVDLAVEYLEKSVQLRPVSEVHAIIGNLLAPSGAALTMRDAARAAHHYEQALELEEGLAPHPGILGVAQRLAIQLHVLNCRAESDAPSHAAAGAETMRAAALMGRACAAYRRWLAMDPLQLEAASVYHFDCGAREVRARPRSHGQPAPEQGEVARSVPGLAAPGRALDTPLTATEVARARERFDLNGAVVFDGVVPSELTTALRRELLRNGTHRIESDVGNTRARLRSSVQGQPDDQTLRWHRAQSPAHGTVGAAVSTIVAKLGGFLAAALRTDVSQVALLECASIVTYPGSEAQSFHADSDRRNVCEATTLVTQLAIVDMEPALGPLELKPGTQGDPNDELDARHQGEPIPMSVQAGAVVAYNSDLVHRGGSNRGERARPVLYLTWMATDDGLLPLHMGYTLPPEDLGRWTVASLRPDADAERDRARLELD